MTDLIIRGGALPTFLLDKVAAATGARSIDVRPPQCVVLRGATNTAEFAALAELLCQEKLNWVFSDREEAA